MSELSASRSSGDAVGQMYGRHQIEQQDSSNIAPPADNQRPRRRGRRDPKELRSVRASLSSPGPWIPVAPEMAATAARGAGERLTQDLASFLGTYLEALPKGTPWLFPSVGARDGHTVDIRKAFVRVVIAAGLDPKRVVRHPLRHTAITHLVQGGCRSADRQAHQRSYNYGDGRAICASVRCAYRRSHG